MRLDSKGEEPQLFRWPLLEERPESQISRPSEGPPNQHLLEVLERGLEAACGARLSGLRVVSAKSRTESRVYRG